MKKFIITILLLTSLPSFAQMVPQWEYKFGNPFFSGANPSGMVIDDSSNVYIFDTVVDYNSTNRTSCFEPVLRKLNKNGQLIWYKNFRVIPCAEEIAFDLKLSNGALFALYERADVGTVLSKLDLNGNILWSNVIGINSNYTYDYNTKLKISNTGVSYVNIKRYNRNLIMKINNSGTLIDSIIVNEGNGYGEVDNFEVSEDNKIVAISQTTNVFPPISFIYLIDSLHNFIWIKNLEANARYPQIIFKNINEIYTAYYSVTSNFRIRMSRFNSQGNTVWNYISSTASYMYWNNFSMYPNLRMDNDGDLIFAGNKMKTNLNSFFVTKVRISDGYLLWQFSLSDIYNVESYLTNIAKDSSGNFYACGRISFANYQSGNSYGIVKLSNSGTLLRTTLNNSYHYASSLPQFIAINNSNDVVITGATADTGNFGYDQSLTIKYSQPVNITYNGNSLPDNFSLSQNYPNPFNPSTTINFQIPKSNFVSLKVFDITGRMVSELVNENLKAGEYKINFDGSALPSGVYYYKLNSENFSETRKMILIK